jgi:hypothetical protein
MTIYTPITPTYLYIKQHSITGLKYFGKTTRDPYKYPGSGKHWTRHIKKHGKEHIVTLWVSELYHDTSIKEHAIHFSCENNIVESIEWANLILENGLDGGTIGAKHSSETLAKMRGRTRSDETKAKMSNAQKNRSHETQTKMSESRKGKKHSIETLTKMQDRTHSSETLAKMRGRTRSDETKAKMSASHKGKTLSAEHKAKISAAGIGRTHTIETKTKISKTKIDKNNQYKP